MIPTASNFVAPVEPTFSCFEAPPPAWAEGGACPTLRVRGAAASHVGHWRANNEDRFLLRPDVGLFAVADGMGGHAGGEVAAAMALECLAESADRVGDDRQDRLLAALRVANAHVYAEGQADKALAGMGTTVSALWFGEGRAVVAHVGDSRVYRLRAGRLEQLSEDHTMMAEAVRSGLDPTTARRIFPPNVLARAVGVRAEVEAQWVECSARAGDRFLLCSDGLTDMVPEHLVAERLVEAVTPAAAAEALLHDALAAGGADNVTVVVLDVL